MSPVVCSAVTGAVTDFAVVFMLRVVQEKHILKEINLERAKLAGQGTKCRHPPDGSCDFGSSCHAITVALSRLSVVSGNNIPSPPGLFPTCLHFLVPRMI